MNAKRLFAILGLIVIAGLYLTALICALIGSPLARSILMAAMFCTMIIPCLIYGMQRILAYLKDREK